MTYILMLRRIDDGKLFPVTRPRDTTVDAMAALGERYVQRFFNDVDSWEVHDNKGKAVVVRPKVW